MDKKQAFENARYELRSTVPKKEEPTVRKGPGRLQQWTKEMEDNLKAAEHGESPTLKQLTKLDNYEDADVPPDVRYPYRGAVRDNVVLANPLKRPPLPTIAHNYTFWADLIFQPESREREVCSLLWREQADGAGVGLSSTRVQNI